MMNRQEWTVANTQYVSELQAVADAAPTGVSQLASFLAEQVGDGVVMRISGEIDMLTTPKLRGLLARLIEARPRVVVLDLAAVSFFASSGLSTLVEARDAATKNGVLLHLARPSRSVRWPLQITGLAARFTTYEDVQAALQS
jgi:anti-sigma B factor antagonist